MSQSNEGCAKPVAGILRPTVSDTAVQTQPYQSQEAKPMLARVGHPAPDFESTAYYNSAFTNIKLSDYKGQWILLCFYPGDFTFV